MRQIELLRCVEEWDHVLAKSQQLGDTQTSTSNKTGCSSEKSAKPGCKADTQKKHCDDQLKVNK